MKALPNLTYQTPAAGRPLELSFDGRNGKANGISFGATVEGDTARLAIDADNVTIAQTLDYFFSHSPELKVIELDRAISFFGGYRVSRSDFAQWPAAWHSRGEYVPAPESWITTNERTHPVRPKVLAGTHYRRYFPAIGKTISFRTLDIARDLATFHAWHNQERVAALWELNKPMEELREYLEKGLKDPHQFPAIVEFDGEPAGYFEIYWTPEDRLGPHYDYDAYDRGIHLLIGPDKFLGTANTYSVLIAVSHFLFLDDHRTRRVMGEPRADNQRMIRYVEMVPGWRKVKEFDFPHKRAALLECDRARFFAGGAL